MFEYENNIYVFELNCDFLILIFTESFIGLHKLQQIKSHRGSGANKIAFCTVITYTSKLYF